MNERIRELAEQATCDIEDKYGNWVGRNFDKEKFAQLIISECAEIALVDGQSSGNFDTFNKIQKHFGVSV